jgi:hypothetical protein
MMSTNVLVQRQRCSPITEWLSLHSSSGDCTTTFFPAEVSISHFMDSSWYDSNVDGTSSKPRAAGTDLRSILCASKFCNQSWIGSVIALLGSGTVWGSQLRCSYYIGSLWSRITWWSLFYGRLSFNLLIFPCPYLGEKVFFHVAIRISHACR